MSTKKKKNDPEEEIPAMSEKELLAAADELLAQADAEEAEEKEKKAADEAGDQKKTKTPEEQLEAMGVGSLRKAVVDGNLQEGTFLSGQVAAMVKKEQPAAEIIREVMEGAEPVLKGTLKWVK